MKREDEILNYIKSFMMENGYTPSIREISNGIHLHSTGATHVHFMKLVKRGDIAMHDKRYSVRGMKYVQAD